MNNAMILIKKNVWVFFYAGAQAHLSFIVDSKKLRTKISNKEITEHLFLESSSLIVSFYCLKMLGKYQRITDDDKGEETGMEMSENVVKLENISLDEPEGEDQYTIKVLYKEQSHLIKGLNENSNVLQLKQLLEPIFQMSPERQRLIFAGKLLKPDNKTLESFKLLHNSSVHLFPIPLPAPPAAVATRVDGTENPLVAQVAQAANPDMAHAPVHFDPLVAQTGREVKLWCLVLLFLSGMTLFNNLSYMSSTGEFFRLKNFSQLTDSSSCLLCAGKVGAGDFDTLVTIADTVSVLKI